jgi:hypothetical protein
MACISSLPLGKDPSSSPKSSAHPHIASNGVTDKECQTLGTWSIYDDSTRRIVFNFTYVFLFLVPFQIKQILIQADICCVLSPTSSLMSQTIPLDMLGGLAKANTWVAKPEGHDFPLLLPLDMLDGLAQSQPNGRST